MMMESHHDLKHLTEIKAPSSSSSDPQGLPEATVTEKNPGTVDPLEKQVGLN